MNDDWPTDDPFFDPKDPASVERERRRLEREERRAQREAKRAKGYDIATTGEKPVPETAQGDGSPPGRVVPPPPPPSMPAQPAQGEDPQPAAPAPRQAPFAGRMAEMRRRAEGVRVPRLSRPGRSSRPERPPRQPGGGGVGAALVSNWGKIALGIVAIIVVWFLVALFQPFHGDGHGKVVLTVQKGASVSEIGDLLENEGVISNSTMFQIRATIEGDRGNLYPGSYTLAKDMSYGDALDQLTTPPAKRGIITATLPEGYSRAQYAPLVKQAGVKGTYMAASKRSKFLNPATYGGRGAKSLEGFLFPDTFEIKYGSPAANLVQLQLQDFKRRIKGVNMKYARSKNLTTYDVLIIASMLQRESGPQDFRNVAAVIYNRLHDGTPLGIDATIRYAVGNYTQPLTQSELAAPSNYNTRIHAGLPPGPIGNPGLAAINAAAHPANVSYMYYVTKPGTCNRLAFATSDAQFQRLSDQYNSARAAAGGNNPDTC
jgi:UPF0755 protein